MKVLKMILPLMMGVLLAGCPAHPPKEDPSSISATGEALARIDTFNKGAADAASKMSPFVVKDGKVYLSILGKAMDDQHAAIASAQNENLKAAKDSAAKDDQISDLGSKLKIAKQQDVDDVANVKATPDYRVGHLAMSLIRIEIGLLIAGFVLRTVGLFVVGVVGATLSWIGTVCLWLVPILGPMINTFCDNHYFRTNWTPKDYVNTVLGAAGGAKP
jgi:uncharacterized cupredoxin-like copper-binding protein